MIRAVVVLFIDRTVVVSNLEVECLCRQLRVQFTRLTI